MLNVKYFIEILDILSEFPASKNNCSVFIHTNVNNSHPDYIKSSYIITYTFIQFYIQINSFNRVFNNQSSIEPDFPFKQQ